MRSLLTAVTGRERIKQGTHIHQAYRDLISHFSPQNPLEPVTSEDLETVRNFKENLQGNLGCMPQIFMLTENVL